MVKEYQHKSSVLKRKSRYVQGGKTELKRKRLGWWERNIDIPKNDVTDILVPISGKYVNRPDLISFDYYGDATLVWIILQYNDIIDVKEELTIGTEITIPSRDRVYYEIMVNSVTVQESVI